MAHHSMPEPDLDHPEPASSTDVQLSAESDLVKLVAKFTAHGGGNLPPELSVDLALEVVLNEIVEQACLATGATGSAVILERDGEMVCRASSGVNAPELGVRLSNESGLTAECIKTRQVQRCDDAASDERVDVEACRSLGVRSFLIFPLVRNGGVAGVLEIFSSLPAAFGSRDERILEALGQRILRNLKRADEPFPAQLFPTGAQNLAPMRATEISKVKAEEHPVESINFAEDRGVADSADPESVIPQSFNSESETSETVERSPRTALDIVTFALCAAVLICTVLLGTLIGMRMGWFGAGRHGHSGSTVTNSQASAPATLAPSPRSSSSSPAGGNAEVTAGEKKIVVSPRASSSIDSALPPGSLLVYEDGKEVFRMSPGGKAKSAEPSAVIQVSPEVAQGALLHRVEPDYPEEARRQQIQGPVVLDVRAGRDGAVQDIKIVSGNPLLAQAATAAAKQWRFKPRIVKGQPVEMETQVTLNFRLPQ